ncbi:MAG TPA: hypothetical protein VF867_00205 [Arthrobacter sp.]
MAQAGDSLAGTPADALTALRESPGLTVATSYPLLGVDYYVGFDAETGQYKNRVVQLGGDANDVDAVIVDEEELTEEDIIFRFSVLARREQDAAEEDPMAAIMRQMMAMGIVVGDEED